MGWVDAVIGFVVAVALACGARAESGRSLVVDGRERTFSIHRPAKLDRDRAVPLVVVLHGGFGTGAQAEGAYHWDEQADRHGFVVAYPDGYRRSWNAGGGCCGRAERESLDDVGFLEELIARVGRDENVDPRRVYVTGISNGAAMAYRFACESDTPVAAIGPVAGSLSAPCARPRPVSVMAIHGLADTRVPFAGGHGNGVASHVSWLGVDASLAPFRTADACRPAVVETKAVVRTLTAACAGGREVVSITVSDAGHQWPGAVPNRGVLASLLRLDPPSEAMDATRALWNFFARHRAD